MQTCFFFVFCFFVQPSIIISLKLPWQKKKKTKKERNLPSFLKQVVVKGLICKILLPHYTEHENAFPLQVIKQLFVRNASGRLPCGGMIHATLAPAQRFTNVAFFSFFSFFNFLFPFWRLFTTFVWKLFATSYFTFLFPGERCCLFLVSNGNMF